MRRLTECWRCLAAAGLATTALAVQAATLTLDASRPPPPPRHGLLQMGSPSSSTSPTGQVLAANDRYLTLNGRPLVPVMGEFHYSRYPRAGWEEQLLKMKAAGVTVLSSYVIWQHHEERAGVFDWSGDRDLRHFVQLAQRHGLMVFLRPGPWVHAEVRFGGLPDWVVDAMPTRSNDPDYLHHVQRLFAQVAVQLRGLLWKEGGPVMGLQIENEYNRVGPLQGPAHIAKLKQLLLAQGLDVPLYTVTGWDRAVWPRGEVIPVFGSYVDEPWAAAGGVLPPRTSYLFQFGVRNEQGLGAQGGNSTQDHGERDADITPFFGAEYGAGVPQMYRRRPLIAPQDIAAMVLTKLGSGVNLLGYYMFHGGQNPPGMPWRGEAVSSGGYNDVPHLGYDFQAPLGQYGQAQPVLHALQPLHLFLQAFGEALATTAVYAPDVQPAAAADLQTLRWAFRGNAGEGQNGGGFLFVNNHVRQHATPAHADTRFTVKLAGRTLTLPTQGFTVAPGAAFIWPLQMKLGSGVNLLWATAQPLTRVDDRADDRAGELLVFAAAGTDAPEFVFDAGVQVQGADVQIIEGRAVLRPAAGRIVTVHDSAGKRARFVSLTAAQARQVTPVQLQGRRHLLLSTAHTFGRADGGVELQQEATDFSFGLYPEPQRPLRGNLAVKSSGRTDLFTHYTASAPRLDLRADVQVLRPAGRAAAVPRTGPRQTPAVPAPEAFGASAAWTLQLPAMASGMASGMAPAMTSDAVAEVFADIAFEGDVARLFSATTMLDDSYYIGRPWRVGLKRYAQHRGGPLTLTVLPLRADAGISFEPGVQPRYEQGQVARLDGVVLTPLYRLTLDAAPAQQEARQP